MIHGFLARPFLMAFAELSEEVYFHCTKEKTTFSIRVKADIKKAL